MKNLLTLTFALIMTVFYSCSPKDTSPLKPPKNGKMYVVAHRGEHVEDKIPENTLAAYQKAIEYGVDFVEIDVRMTKDKHFISMHNGNVNKYVLEDIDKDISEMTLAEVRKLDIGSRIGPEWKGTQVPTFEEILDLCKGKCGIYLDLKQAPVKPLIDIIRSKGMIHDVIWYADDGELEAVKKLEPECIIMPDPGPEKNLPELIERFHPKVIAAVWKYMSDSFVKTCHDAGAIVIVDDKGPDTWKPMVDWGVDGIQTNRPAELIRYIKEKK